jgi:hypothetical protein
LLKYLCVAQCGEIWRKVVFFYTSTVPFNGQLNDVSENSFQNCPILRHFWGSMKPPYGNGDAHRHKD